MPRLRRVQNLKYGGLRSDSDDGPIDTLEQENLIASFKQSINLTHSKSAKLIFRCYLISLLFFNMIFITFPYYRKGINGLFSALACIMLFFPSILAYSTLYHIDSNFLQALRNIKVLSIFLMMYTLLIISKLLWLSIDVRSDLLYIVPILLTICILDIHRDKSHLTNAINELETLKYDYKEA